MSSFEVKIRIGGCCGSMLYAGSRYGKKYGKCA